MNNWDEEIVFNDFQNAVIRFESFDSIHVENMAGLTNFTYEFNDTNINILIGKNGLGKTSTFKIVQLLFKKQERELASLLKTLSVTSFTINFKCFLSNVYNEDEENFIQQFVKDLLGDYYILTTQRDKYHRVSCKKSAKCFCEKIGANLKKENNYYRISLKIKPKKFGLSYQISELTDVNDDSIISNKYNSISTIDLDDFIYFPNTELLSIDRILSNDERKMYYSTLDLLSKKMGIDFSSGNKYYDSLHSLPGICLWFNSISKLSYTKTILENEPKKEECEKIYYALLINFIKSHPEMSENEIYYKFAKILFEYSYYDREMVENFFPRCVNQFMEFDISAVDINISSALYNRKMRFDKNFNDSNIYDYFELTDELVSFHFKNDTDIYSNIELFIKIISSGKDEMFRMRDLVQLNEEMKNDINYSQAQLILDASEYMDKLVFFEGWKQIIDCMIHVNYAFERITRDSKLTLNYRNIFSDVFVNKHGSRGKKDMQIDPINLSSGEQNLISILFTIVSFCVGHNKDERHLIFIDEPENSLHISWQEELIPAINELLTNLKCTNISLIVATHSPSILEYCYELGILPENF